MQQQLKTDLTKAAQLRRQNAGNRTHACQVKRLDPALALPTKPRGWLHCPISGMFLSKWCSEGHGSGQLLFWGPARTSSWVVGRLVPWAPRAMGTLIDSSRQLNLSNTLGSTLEVATQWRVHYQQYNSSVCTAPQGTLIFSHQKLVGMVFEPISRASRVWMVTDGLPRVDPHLAAGPTGARSSYGRQGLVPYVQQADWSGPGDWLWGQSPQ